MQLLMCKFVYRFVQYVFSLIVDFMLGRCFDLFGPASCSDFKAMNWCAMPFIRENCCITCGQGDEIEPEGNNNI